MSILYHNTIPAAANNPSDDQPDMQDNTDAIDQIIAVDHVSFNVGAGDVSGTHEQVTFNAKNVPGAQTDPKSCLYTDDGTASTNAEAFFRNADAIFPVSALKAFANYTVPAVNGVFSENNGYNITTLDRINNSVKIEITLAANCVHSNFATIVYVGTGSVTQVGTLITINGAIQGSTNMILVFEA